MYPHCTNIVLMVFVGTVIFVKSHFARFGPTSRVKPGRGVTFIEKKNYFKTFQKMLDFLFTQVNYY